MVRSCMTACALLATAFCFGAEEGELHLRFTVTNPSARDLRTIVRVSLPVPQGLLTGTPQAMTVRGAAGTAIAQTAVLTRHPDGSVRRLMLSVPVSLAGGQQAQFECSPGGSVPAPASMLQQGEPLRIKTEPFIVVVSGNSVQLTDDKGGVLATVDAFGPEPTDTPAKVRVLEAGPHCVWLRCNTDGAEWSGEVDIEVDRYGRISLTHRLQARKAGDQWTPDFGFEVSARGATLTKGASPATTVRFQGLPYQALFSEHPELVVPVTLAGGTQLSIANPLAIRQNRGTLDLGGTEGAVYVRSSRNEPVEDLQKNGLMIQEGQWRVSRLTLAPVEGDALARSIDGPVQAHADWRLYDAVYHTGAPLEAKSPLIRRVADKYVQALQAMSISGDDWGNMTGWAPQDSRQQINSMVRYNHCRYVWEDYFRSGDPRLRAVALDWSENYRNLSIYWGPDKNFYGGSRRGRALRDKPGSPPGPGTYMIRYNNAIGWITKGFAAFWLAYEETGDPRFREAAEIQAKWSAANTTCLTQEMRSVGSVADYAKLYEYTHEPFYLTQAVRLWEEFKQGQLDNLLFTQHGKPAVGDHLYIGDDDFGYKHPFVKPYMVQYATNSLPYLLELRPDDQRLRDTILALNDWMATHRQPGGGWGYPHYLTAGMGWNNEYCYGIALACKIEPKDTYLDAIRENLAPVTQLLEDTTELSSGLNPWEDAAKINAAQRQAQYQLATDRPAMRDYDEGQVRFGQSPDNAVYAGALLRDYLQYRSEESLLSEYPLLAKMKRLRTSLDPRVTLPARVAPGADFAVTVEFQGTEALPASARIAALPEGVVAEPASLNWTVTRGKHPSPAVRLKGTCAADTKLTVHWTVGSWEGEATTTLAAPGAK
jgi:hypothetical protein